MTQITRQLVGYLHGYILDISPALGSSKRFLKRKTGPTTQFV